MQNVLIVMRKIMHLSKFCPEPKKKSTHRALMKSLSQKNNLSREIKKSAEKDPWMPSVRSGDL